MKHLSLLLLPPLLALGALPGTAQTVASESEVRVVEVTTEPEKLSFGEPFQLHVTMRLRPGTAAVLADTLLPADAAQSLGTGSWRASRAAGDTVEITASYPVIGYNEGRLDLPSVELWLRPADAPPGAGLRDDDRRMVRLGAVIVAPIAAMADSGAVLVPRPPAGVIGGEWSIWLLLAVGLASTAGAGGVGLVLARWWKATGAALVARVRGRSPRQEALGELERIRSLGWHRNGRVDDFYALSTDTLRRYAEQIEPDWRPALTSSELLSRLEGRWGADRAGALAPTIRTAERVKFGSDRPTPEAAEADWAAIRDWIRSAPET